MGCGGSKVKPTPPFIPDASKHWEFRPDKDYSTAPMRSDFLTYRELAPGSLGHGVIGVGTVELKVRWDHVIYPRNSATLELEVRHNANLKKRWIGQLKAHYAGSSIQLDCEILPKDPYPRRDEKVWTYENSVFGRRCVFIVRNGLIRSKDFEPIE